MPDSLATIHPQVVHFAIALLFVGVLLRWLAFSGRVDFADRAAATLLLLGTLASVGAVQSGVDAHGPVERIPGAAGVVHEHEEWGERARNLFLVIAALELAWIALPRWKRRRWLLVTSAVVGVPGLVAVYEAAEHGGEVVYDHAGGVATRSGELEDPARLLLAGLYHQAMHDRAAGRPEQAARWFALLAEQFPDDFEVQLAVAGSVLEDRKEPRAALERLDSLTVAPDDRRMQIRYVLLKADALEADGQREAARTAVAEVAGRFPGHPRLEARLAELQ